MAHNIFKLDREVPETIMSGKTADISQFCELGWYEWVKFCFTTVSFLEVPLVHGKYLSLSIVVGLAMTAKTLTPMGEVVHRNTYRQLTPKEFADPVKRNHMK